MPPTTKKKKADFRSLGALEGGTTKEVVAALARAQGMLEATHPAGQVMGGRPFQVHQLSSGGGTDVWHSSLGEHREGVAVDGMGPSIGATDGL